MGLTYMFCTPRPARAAGFPRRTRSRGPPPRRLPARSPRARASEKPRSSSTSAKEHQRIAMLDVVLRLPPPRDRARRSMLRPTCAHRSDRSWLRSASGPSPRRARSTAALRRFIHRADILPVDDDARHAIAVRALGDIRLAVTLRHRGGDGIADCSRRRRSRAASTRRPC